MKIELRKLSEIIPYDKNPRLNDAAVDAVATSIKEFGFRQPIVVDDDGVIVVGHTRYKAAQKLGLTEVPVHVATGLIKSVVYGVIISVISCYKGLQCGEGAEGVGRATTEAVVYSSITVLISNFFLTLFLNRVLPTS